MANGKGLGKKGGDLRRFKRLRREQGFEASAGREGVKWRSDKSMSNKRSRKELQRRGESKNMNSDLMKKIDKLLLQRKNSE